MATTSESVVSAVSPSQERLIRDTLRSHYELPAGQIASLLSSLSDQLSKCDEEVAKLERKITEINAHRAVLLGQYHDCQTLLAPARRLPPEILGEIFTLTSDSASTSASANGNSNYAASLERIANSSILALSQVCARWHDIALGTPALWSKVELDAVLWQSPETAKNAMLLLQVFLSRGGNFPRSILITNNTDMPFHGPALQLLAQHSLRWRSATFKCPVADLRHLAPVNGNLPILEILEIFLLGRGRRRCPFSKSRRGWGISLSARLYSAESPPHLSTNCRRLDWWIWLQRISLRQSPRWRTCLARTVFVCGFISTTGSAVGVMHFVLTSPIHLRMSAASQSNSLASSIATTASRHWPPSLLASRCHPCSLNSSPSVRVPGSRAIYIPSISSTSKSPRLSCAVSLCPACADASGSHRPRTRSWRGANLVVISDSLLEALTRTSDAPCLVPHLESLHIRSRLCFTDDVYLAMVVSRLEPGGRRFKSLVESCRRGLTVATLTLVL
ncbi:hypothetical protein B0H16DRAFT_114793 [Mycena metata]|uniref:F-box domain-containing protein n=1 Tax=Mycena metata TaxID=1033252 RepID=A0AAD7NTH4_9AGAR|nr:hypothetical protein B0H16DRAFT_114793 [Mycena metata]